MDATPTSVVGCQQNCDQTFDTKPFFCKFCEFSCFETMKLQEHIHSLHFIPNADDKVCIFCNSKRFKTEKSFNKHRGTLRCQVNEKNFYNNNITISEIKKKRKADKIITCNACGKCFNKILDLKKHLKMSKFHNKVDEEKYRHGTYLTRSKMKKIKAANKMLRVCNNKKYITVQDHQNTIKKTPKTFQSMTMGCNLLLNEQQQENMSMSGLECLSNIANECKEIPKFHNSLFTTQQQENRDDETSTSTPTLKILSSIAKECNFILKKQQDNSNNSDAISASTSSSENLSSMINACETLPNKHQLNQQRPTVIVTHKRRPTVIQNNCVDAIDPNTIPPESITTDSNPKLDNNSHEPAITEHFQEIELTDVIYDFEFDLTLFDL